MTDIEIHNCDNCRHACFSTYDPSPSGVCLGSGSMEDFACGVEDEMTDEDVELCNAGRCPKWEKAEERTSEEEYYDFLCEEDLE